MGLLGCKKLADFINLLRLGRDDKLVADTQIRKQTCGFVTLVFSMRSLYFSGQRFALNLSPAAQGPPSALDRLGKKGEGRRRRLCFIVFLQD